MPARGRRGGSTPPLLDRAGEPVFGRRSRDGDDGDAVLLASVGASAAALDLSKGSLTSVTLPSFCRGLLGSSAPTQAAGGRGLCGDGVGMASFALARAGGMCCWAVSGLARRGARTPVRNVLMAEATTPQTYGRAYGFERAMDSIAP